MKQGTVFTSRLFRIFHVYDVFSFKQKLNTRPPLLYWQNVESASLDLVVNLYVMIISLNKDSNLKSNFIILLLFEAGVAG